jgi:hypothetical protein
MNSSHAARATIVNVKVAKPPNVACNKVAKQAINSSETSIRSTALKKANGVISYSSRPIIAPTV